jgi:Rieske 2Fe-2S family protein
MDLLNLLRSRKPGYTMPQPFYNDPDIFAADLDAIFHRHWLFVAASCEISQPGEFVTVQIGPTSILLLRDQNGAVRGYFNTCRHRGARIVDAPRGHMRSVTCPYHRWTYALSGELSYAAYMPEEFDRGEFPLRPVHVREVCGTLYVCLADEPPDFSAYADAVTPQLAPHALDKAKLALEVDLIEYGNWKLTMENSRECYHCATSHRDLVKTLLDIYDFRDPSQTQPIVEYWRAWDAAGLPSGVAEGPDFRANRLPLVNGAKSITLDGAPACRKPLGIGPRDVYGSMRWVHYPSTFNHAMDDYAVLVRMLPIAPQETLVTTKFLVNKDAVEGVDYDLQHLSRVWNTTNAEDKALVERNQAGVNSFGYVPGPYSRDLEAGISKFVDWYCAKMQHYALRRDKPQLALAG